MRTILLTIALLAMGACNATDENGSNMMGVASNVTNYVAEVDALPERQRNAVFFRAIRDAGLPCQNVTKSEQIDSTGRAAMWRAQCEDGTAHLVQVMPDGTANVVSRATP